MANIKQNRIEIRGLTDDEINYLKAVAEKNKANSFNDFLLSICREKLITANLIVLKICTWLI